MDDNDDICENRARGNKQSGEAFARLGGSIRASVLAYISANAGATCEQVEQDLKLKHQTASARISELKRDEQIEIIGTKRISSGCDAARYRAVVQEKQRTLF